MLWRLRLLSSFFYPLVLFVVSSPLWQTLFSLIKLVLFFVHCHKIENSETHGWILSKLLSDVLRPCHYCTYCSTAWKWRSLVNYIVHKENKYHLTFFYALICFQFVLYWLKSIITMDHIQQSKLKPYLMLFFLSGLCLIVRNSSKQL